jgi:hypothetical protein
MPYTAVRQGLSSRLQRAYDAFRDVATRVPEIGTAVSLAFDSESKDLGWGNRTRERENFFSSRTRRDELDFRSRRSAHDDADELWVRPARVSAGTERGGARGFHPTTVRWFRQRLLFACGGSYGRRIGHWRDAAVDSEFDEECLVGLGAHATSVQRAKDALCRGFEYIVDADLRHFLSGHDRSLLRVFRKKGVGWAGEDLIRS